MNEHAGSDGLAYGFAGEAYDAKSQLAYHRARWMDARVGRFLGMDPLLGRVGHPKTNHRFMYADSDPIDTIDPTGEFGMAAAGAVGIGIGVMSTMANIGRIAIAATIVCAAQATIGSFFSTSTDKGFCKARWFNHYSNEKGHEGIRRDGFINPSSDGYVYLTPDIYFSGLVAKSRLALKTQPTGFFRIPETSIVDIEERGQVKKAYGEDGGGNEWVSSSPDVGTSGTLDPGALTGGGSPNRHEVLPIS